MRQLHDVCGGDIKGANMIAKDAHLDRDESDVTEDGDFS